jgi:hypothetical protein
MLDKASDDEKERLDRRIIPEHYDRIPPGSRYYEYRRQQHSAKAETRPPPQIAAQAAECTQNDHLDAIGSQIGPLTSSTSPLVFRF